MKLHRIGFFSTGCNILQHNFFFHYLVNNKNKIRFVL